MFSSSHYNISSDVVLDNTVWPNPTFVDIWVSFRHRGWGRGIRGIRERFFRIDAESDVC